MDTDVLGNSLACGALTNDENKMDSNVLCGSLGDETLISKDILSPYDSKEIQLLESALAILQQINPKLASIEETMELILTNPHLQKLREDLSE